MGGIRTAIPAMAAGLAAAWACGVAAFACNDDAQCGASGACEASGYCSFVDDACPAGRRYGSRAPKELADRCVAPVDESTGAVAEVTGADTTLDPSTSSSSSTSPTTTIGPSTSEANAESSSGVPSGESSTGEAGSSSGGPPQPACDVVFVDDFEDGVVDPEWDTWSSAGTYFAEDGGRLVFSIGPSAVDWISAGLNTQLHFFLGGSARAEVVPFDPPLDVIGVWLTVFDPDGCEAQLAVESSALQIKAGDTWYDGGPVDSTQSLWLQLRIDPDGYVHWEYSIDADTWTEVHGEAISCDFASARSAIFAGGMHDQTDPIVRAVESYERCEAQ